jgi:hypothetical protein
MLPAELCCNTLGTMVGLAAATAHYSNSGDSGNQHQQPHHHPVNMVGQNLQCIRHIPFSEQLQLRCCISISAAGDQQLVAQPS